MFMDPFMMPSAHRQPEPRIDEQCPEPAADMVRGLVRVTLARRHGRELASMILRPLTPFRFDSLVLSTGNLHLLADGAYSLSRFSDLGTGFHGLFGFGLSGSLEQLPTPDSAERPLCVSIHTG